MAFYYRFLSIFTSIITMVVMASEDKDFFPVRAYWYTDPVKAPFVYMESTMIVPPVPPQEWKTLFLWPGLQPLDSSPHYEPAGNGVLQPVLTWGKSCAPHSDEFQSQEGWWISAQYVNTYVANTSSFSGCSGGNAMYVNPGDSIQMIMKLEPNSTVWKQIVINKSNQKSVSFERDLQGQAQGWAKWIMEIPGGWHQTKVPKWNVTNIILRTHRNVKNATEFGFCDYRQKLSSESQAPGRSLSCTRPVNRRNQCRISLCKFNQ